MELKEIAAKAEAAKAANNISEAAAHWRRALELLPRGSSQHEAVRQKVNDLVKRLDAAPSVAPQKPKWAARTGVLGAIGLLLWKFKFIVIFIFTKAKLLLLGLTKGSTFFSMLLSIGVYWAAFGWQLAVGLALSIYVHEMGHIYQLSRYGIRASAPMFIPGLGAMIRVKQYPASPHENARTGLAGPIWGLGAAIFSYALHLGTGMEVFAAIAKVGAWINLFNLLPLWQLDGGHAFGALSRVERGCIAAIMVAMWILTHEGLLIILALAAAFRAFQKNAPVERDTPVFVEFAVLLLALSALSVIGVNV